MTVQDKWHLNSAIRQLKKQKHWAADKKKTLFFLPRKALCIAEKCFLFGLTEEFKLKVVYRYWSWHRILPGAVLEVHLAEMWRLSACTDLCCTKMRLSIWISIWRIKVFALKKEIFPATPLAGTIIKIVFEHLITLLMYSHREVKLINFSLMHTLVIFLHFPGHKTNHKNRKVSPSNRYFMAGTGGHFWSKMSCLLFSFLTA